jgi:cytoskeletal protein CcmA (bactofilin family)
MIWKREDADATQAPQREGSRERSHDHERKETRMTDNGEVTIVGTGARLEGNVVSAGSLRIDGQVKGQINADGDVVLSPQSQVDADIRAQNVSIAGRFKGNVIVKGKAHLARGGRIDGNISSKTLVVEEGGIFHGQSIMDATGAAAASSSSSPQQAASSQAGAAAEKKEPDTTKV